MSALLASPDCLAVCRPGRARSEAGLDVLIVAGVVVAALTGHLAQVAVLWIAPFVATAMFLVYFFDYLPHRPYDSTERFFDTRSYPSRILNIVLLGQNYHSIHHAWNTIPWWRYQRVFASVRPDLEAMGARTTAGAYRGPLSGPATAPA